jgi:hypothetical protein
MKKMGKSIMVLVLFMNLILNNAILNLVIKEINMKKLYNFLIST